MRVIALANQKGGTGKSTIAIQCAVTLERLGHKAAVLDLDPQQSATWWYGLRDEAAKGPLVQSVSHGQLRAVLEALRQSGIAAVLLDLPGRHAPTVTEGIRDSDLVLIPTRVDGFDLKPSGDTIAAVLAAKKPYAFVLNLIEAKSVGEAQETAKALESAGHAVAPTHIVRRKDIRMANEEGRGVIESAPKGKSATEMKKLATWAMEFENNEH